MHPHFWGLIFILQHTEAICAFSNFCCRQTEWVLPEGAIWHSLFQTSQELPTACYISMWCACAWVRPQCWAPSSSLSNCICSVCARVCVWERASHGSLGCVSLCCSLLWKLMGFPTEDVQNDPGKWFVHASVWLCACVWERKGERQVGLMVSSDSHCVLRVCVCVPVLQLCANR